MGNAMNIMVCLRWFGSPCHHGTWDMEGVRNLWEISLKFSVSFPGSR